MEAKFKDFDSVIKRVEFLLKQNPDLAYNSDKLIHTYLYNEIGAEVVNEMSGYDLFLRLVSKYEPLTKIETISRAKRMVVAKLKLQGLLQEKPEPQKTIFTIKNFD